MSEFTAGVLYQAKDSQAVEEQLKHTRLRYMIRPLNQAWKVLLTADQFLMNESTVRALRQVSWVAPLLFFHNAEDHGWGYRIFHRGSELDAFFDLLDAGDEEQEDAQGWDLPDPSIGEIAHFRAFDLPEETIAAIDQVVALWQPDTDRFWERVEAFKAALGMAEMSWVSYSYAMKDQSGD